MTGLTGIKVINTTHRTDDPITYTERSLLESFEGACQLASAHGLSCLVRASARIASRHPHLSACLACHQSTPTSAKMLVGSQREQRPAVLINLHGGRGYISIRCIFQDLTFSLQGVNDTVTYRSCKVVLNLRCDKITGETGLHAAGDGIALATELDMLARMTSTIIAELSHSLTLDSLEVVPQLLADSMLRLLQLPGTSTLWKVEVLAGCRRDSGEYLDSTAARYLDDWGTASSPRKDQWREASAAGGDPIDDDVASLAAASSDLAVDEDRNVGTSTPRSIQPAEPLACGPEFVPLSMPGISATGHEHMSIVGPFRVQGQLIQDLRRAPT